MRFEKWQALGNDYLIIERRSCRSRSRRPAYEALRRPPRRRRRRDPVAVAAVRDPAHVADLRIFNPDGSEAELSGNGAREAILYLRRRGWTERRSSRSTRRPARSARRSPGRTRAVWTWAARAYLHRLPRRARGRTRRARGGRRSWAFQHVSIGNPQCAIQSARSRSSWRWISPRSAQRSKGTTVSESHERILVPPRSSSGPEAYSGAHLRAWRGGDVVLGHGRDRGGGRAPRLRARRPAQIDGAARRRRARGRRWGRICT